MSEPLYEPMTKEEAAFLTLYLHNVAAGQGIELPKDEAYRKAYNIMCGILTDPEVDSA